MCSLRFLIPNKLEQLEFKLEKKYWDLETCRKIQKKMFCFLNLKFEWLFTVFSRVLDGAQQYPSMGINGSCRKTSWRVTVSAVLLTTTNNSRTVVVGFQQQQKSQWDQNHSELYGILLKFIYSVKATKFCEIFTLLSSQCQSKVR